MPKPRRRTPSASTSATSITHRIHTLLHTVRNIAYFEDELCTLLHESERTENLSPEASDELLDLLARMPGDEYLSDIDAVRDALHLKPAPPQAKAAPARRKSKPLPPVKGRRRS